MRLLAIETSCDETACSIVSSSADGLQVNTLSSVLATSRELHEETGGVVPEIAARKQLESFVPVIDMALKKSNLSRSDIDYVAVTAGPGLIGSLLIGVEGAKALAYAWDKPLVPVNHLIGHIYGNFVDNPRINELKFPAIVLVVSGGHTDIVLMRAHNEFEFLGGTLDDAAGEAFDKTARLLGISNYLGGVKLSKLAATYTPALHGELPQLPKPLYHDKSFDMSFSGLKTAVKRVIDQNTFMPEAVAYAFEETVADILTKKVIDAMRLHNAQSILLGGGVSANTKLRSKFSSLSPVPVFYPPIDLCTDTATYIGAAAYFLLQDSTYIVPNLSSINADSSLTITSSL